MTRFHPSPAMSRRDSRRVLPLPLGSRRENSCAAIRPTRIATAQARIAADYYSRGEVRERLVEALLRELEER